LKQRGLPFQPENIIKNDNYKDIMAQAIAIEAEIDDKFYSKERPSGEEYI